MRSSSTSNSFRSSYLHIFYCSIYLLLDITVAKGSKFNPLIQLPTNELYRNISRTVVLCIDDFGAKGDGFTYDTEVKCVFLEFNYAKKLRHFVVCWFPFVVDLCCSVVGNDLGKIEESSIYKFII